MTAPKTFRITAADAKIIRDYCNEALSGIGGRMSKMEIGIKADLVTGDETVNYLLLTEYGNMDTADIRDWQYAATLDIPCDANGEAILDIFGSSRSELLGNVYPYFRDGKLVAVHDDYNVVNRIRLNRA
jgi:hypothetical protein